MSPTPFPRVPPADLVLVGGRIVTLEESPCEVEALAARGGRIVALGSRSEIEGHIGDETRVLDLAGQLALPGFIESHAHLLWLGDSKVQLDLARAASWEEIVARVAAAAEEARPGELIRGRGWHQEQWERRPEPALAGFPDHASLSAVSPENPVLLEHASCHASFANAAAMAACGIDAGTPDPVGGRIVRDGDGAPTGVFLETAEELLQRVQATATPPDPRRLVELARDECLAHGITSFHDAGASFETVDLLREMAEEGSLGLRLWVMLGEPNERLVTRLDDFPWVGYADHHLTVRAIKRFSDGALGSRGAWFLEPYSDRPESAGLNTTPIAEIEETARIALAADLQLCTHAIGDRANREVLDLYQRAFATLEDAEDGPRRRWRIEHAQHLHPDDVPRFRELGVTVCFQGIHCTSDATWVPARLGEERARTGAYPWRSLLDAGARLSNGTDAPVEPVDPLRSLHATLTRRLADGSRFHPEQCLTRSEALRSYTLGGAYAACEEQLKGSLAPGKLADLVVLDTDLLTCSVEEIPTARVLATIVGGRVLYEAP